MDKITAQQVKDIFNDIFYDKFVVKITAAELNQPLTSGIGMDSLDIYEVLMELEKKCNISVSEEETSDIARGTVKTLLSIFVDKLVTANRLTRVDADLVLSTNFWKTPTQKIAENKKAGNREAYIQPASNPVKMVSVPKPLLEEYTATLNHLKELEKKMNQYTK